MRTRVESGKAFADKRLTLFAALTVSALLGALFGTMCWCYGGEKAQLLETLRGSYIEVRRSGDIAAVLTSAAAGTGVYLAAALLLSFSATAQPFEFLLPFLRGMTCGVILTAMNGGELTKAAALRTAAVFPGVFISLLITVLACREAFTLSGKLFAICFRGESTNGTLDRVKLTAVRFAVLAAAASAGAVIDCGICMLFMKL